jgi:hypothetical protein
MASQRALQILDLAADRLQRGWGEVAAGQSKRASMAAKMTLFIDPDTNVSLKSERGNPSRIRA